MDRTRVAQLRTPPQTPPKAESGRHLLAVCESMAASDGVAGQLAKLAELWAKGALDESEFKAAKAMVLAAAPPGAEDSTAPPPAGGSSAPSPPLSPAHARCVSAAGGACSAAIAPAPVHKIDTQVLETLVQERSAAAPARMSWNERAASRATADVPLGRRRPGSAANGRPTSSGGRPPSAPPQSAGASRTGSLGGSIPVSPGSRNGFGAAAHASGRPRPTSAAAVARAPDDTRTSRARAAAVAATLALEARGSNPRHTDGLQAPDLLPSVLRRPLCYGAMPARPLPSTSKVHPAPRPKSVSPTRGPAGPLLDPSGHEERTVAEVIAYTKPRVLGGGWSRESKANPPKTVNPLDSTGGKAVGDKFPWVKRDSGVFPEREPMKQGGGARPLRTTQRLNASMANNYTGQFVVEMSLGTTTLG